MPRKPGPRRDARSRTWIAQLGTPSPKTGRRGRVTLRNEDGTVVKYEDHAGAHAAFARLMAASEAQEKRVAGPTACDVVVEFIRWHEASGSMPDTIATHRWHLFRFLDFEHGGVRYNDRPAASIEVRDWTRFRKDMEAKGSQTGYVRLAFSSVHACWRWAARPVEDREPLRMIPANPFEGLKRPRKGKGRRLVLPWSTIQDLGRFVAGWVDRPHPEGAHRNRKVAINRQRPANRLKALACRLIIECGCRPKEAAILRWDWVREADRVIEIPEEFIKIHEDRLIALTPGMADELARLRGSGESHATWVFVPARDERRDELDAKKLAEWFSLARHAARKAGIVLPPGTSLYTFRHSLVTLAREAGMDLRHIAPAFGHSAETAEGTYSHFRPNHIVGLMDEARERIAEKDVREKEGRET